MQYFNYDKRSNILTAMRTNVTSSKLMDSFYGVYCYTVF